MTTKEKADALVEKHKPYAYVSIHFAEVMKYEHTLNATNCAIKSVEYTIEVLNSVFEKQEGTTDTYPTANAVLEQSEILTELKSRV